MRRRAFGPIFRRFLTISGLTLLVFIAVQRAVQAAAIAAALKEAADLLEIALIALIVAALLSPLEALGWWAGWYGDRVSPRHTDEAVPAPKTQTAERYVVYLDGIGKFEAAYAPEVETFLEALEQALPQAAIVRGIMPYSILDQTLLQGRPLALFWRTIDWLREQRFLSVLSALVNLRNLLVVAVAADKRYGPVYDRGMAQLIYNRLIERGYPPNSQIPITLLGYSGGGEIALGASSLLKQALGCPIDVISLAGVFCGRNDILGLEHVYHLVGDKDPVERLGAVMFPKRWKIMFLSYWNRAKQRGQISIISLGPVGHQSPGGVMDPVRRLPDGRTHLEQTLDWVTGIVEGRLPQQQPKETPSTSSYSLYQRSKFNQPQTYPVRQFVPDRYRAIAPWMGRLILPQPAERQPKDGVWFEVYHAAADYAPLVGQVVWMTWQDVPAVQDYLRTVTRDVHFSPDADYSLQQGKIVPVRLDGWRAVGPLESLAGARPTDNLVVMLNGEVVVEDNTRILIEQDPAQISGRFYAIAQFLTATKTTDEGVFYTIRYFDRKSSRFDGATDEVFLPQVVPNQNGLRLSSTQALEQSPCNPGGWYLYGAWDDTGRFVVQALAPYTVLSLMPEREITGLRACQRYLEKKSWRTEGVKGTVNSVLLRAEPTAPPFEAGDRLLLNHVYGGIGGQQAEPAAQGPVYFGHFAYGIADVVTEPLTGELRLDIQYFQVYTHNPDGLIACRHHWSNYMGDRQSGWLGARPVRDIVTKLPAFTDCYRLNNRSEPWCPLDELLHQLQIMMARYRIGDGTGVTFVGPANNCAQDSSQSLYGALQQILGVYSEEYQDKLEMTREQRDRLRNLKGMARSLRNELLPLGTARADWKTDDSALGSSLEDDPLKQLARGILSWRTLLPRVASDVATEVFLKRNAIVLVLRTNQVGGHMPTIEPVAPIG